MDIYPEFGSLLERQEALNRLYALREAQESFENYADPKLKEYKLSSGIENNSFDTVTQLKFRIANQTDQIERLISLFTGGKEGEATVTINQLISNHLEIIGQYHSCPVNFTIIEPGSEFVC